MVFIGDTFRYWNTSLWIRMILFLDKLIVSSMWIITVWMKKSLFFFFFYWIRIAESTYDALNAAFPFSFCKNNSLSLFTLQIKSYECLVMFRHRMLGKWNKVITSNMISLSFFQWSLWPARWWNKFLLRKQMLIWEYEVSVEFGESRESVKKVN